MSAPFRLVLLRHGHSEWNLTDRFTGWTDIALTDIGLQEAALCGRIIAEADFAFDEVHLSALKRTRQTAEQLLLAAQHPAIPMHTSWRLNERHYGELQGLDKQQIFAQWGKEQSRRWWRGFTDAPPALDHSDLRHPRHDPLYRDIEPQLMPGSESLQQCQQRLIPYWQQTLTPRIQAGRRLLVVSHGNTLRALRMHVEDISPKDIEQVEIPSAQALVYYFDQHMRLLDSQWLAAE
ncbi:MAG: 2,3-bisphosphoglycerate-dependent phosphoglycerate mutase [Gammaproteobacteria bacterium]|nr:2,3-bisphosphoglycerate-dependent phosphoglycerate mutase [Gammaproteobacteria bacterium]